MAVWNVLNKDEIISLCHVRILLEKASNVLYSILFIRGCVFPDVTHGGTFDRRPVNRLTLGASDLDLELLNLPVNLVLENYQKFLYRK